MATDGAGMVGPRAYGWLLVARRTTLTPSITAEVRSCSVHNGGQASTGTRHPGARLQKPLPPYDDVTRNARA
jgi:hypothetical protein